VASRVRAFAVSRRASTSGCQVFGSSPRSSTASVFSRSQFANARGDGRSATIEWIAALSGRWKAAAVAISMRTESLPSVERTTSGSYLLFGGSLDVHGPAFEKRPDPFRASRNGRLWLTSPASTPWRSTYSGTTGSKVVRFPEWHLAGVRFKRYGRNSIIRDGLLASTGDLQAAALLIANLRGFCGVSCVSMDECPSCTTRSRPQRSRRGSDAGSAFSHLAVPSIQRSIHRDTRTNRLNCLALRPADDDLDIVRVNIPNQAVARALGCSVPDIPPATLVLTVRFEKNGFKYQEFSLSTV